jgi:hypothetical protein
MIDLDTMGSMGYGGLVSFRTALKKRHLLGPLFMFFSCDEKLPFVDFVTAEKLAADPRFQDKE